MKIAIEAHVRAGLDTVWSAWNTPDDIKRWNAASDDWHTTRSEVDLREGGTFSARMEARDGSFGFDFGGTYTRVVPQQLIEFRLGDGRMVETQFIEQVDGVLVKEAFDAESQNDPEMQRRGWQAILDNFARYVEANRNSGR